MKIQISNWSCQIDGSGKMSIIGKINNGRFFQHGQYGKVVFIDRREAYRFQNGHVYSFEAVVTEPEKMKVAIATQVTNVVDLTSIREFVNYELVFDERNEYERVYTADRTFSYHRPTIKVTTMKLSEAGRGTVEVDGHHYSSSIKVEEYPTYSFEHSVPKWNELLGKVEREITPDEREWIRLYDEYIRLVWDRDCWNEKTTVINAAGDWPASSGTDIVDENGETFRYKYSSKPESVSGKLVAYEFQKSITWDSEVQNYVLRTYARALYMQRYKRIHVMMDGEKITRFKLVDYWANQPDDLKPGGRTNDEFKLVKTEEIPFEKFGQKITRTIFRQVGSMTDLDAGESDRHHDAVAAGIKNPYGEAYGSNFEIFTEDLEERIYPELTGWAKVRMEEYEKYSSLHVNQVFPRGKRLWFVTNFSREKNPGNNELYLAMKDEQNREAERTSHSPITRALRGPLTEESWRQEVRTMGYLFPNFEQWTKQVSRESYIADKIAQFGEKVVNRQNIPEMVTSEVYDEKPIHWVYEQVRIDVSNLIIRLATVRDQYQAESGRGDIVDIATMMRNLGVHEAEAYLIGAKIVFSKLTEVNAEMQELKSAKDTSLPVWNNLGDLYFWIPKDFENVREAIEYAERYKELQPGSFRTLRDVDQRLRTWNLYRTEVIALPDVVIEVQTRVQPNLDRQARIAELRAKKGLGDPEKANEQPNLGISGLFGGNAH